MSQTVPTVSMLLRSGKCRQPSKGGGAPLGTATGRLPSALGLMLDGPAKTLEPEFLCDACIAGMPYQYVM